MLDMNPRTNLRIGFRFHPADEELIVRYLSNGLPSPASAIPEFDVFQTDPWGFPDRRGFSNRFRRGNAGSGSWKSFGKEKIIMDFKNTQVVGTTKTLIFCERKRPHSQRRTNRWFLYDYGFAGSPCLPISIQGRMKSSLGKLRKLMSKNDSKHRQFQPVSKFDELAQAALDMQSMRNCYDSLLSAAAAMTNSAYEFSESLREMGSCLEKSAIHEDEQSGRILSTLAMLQFELQKLLDRYRAHVILTITNPSESLLNELRTVEEMKRHCDEKRQVYEYMISQQREKGKSKSGNGEKIAVEQLQAAHDEYDEEATLCIFRVKSLKEGQMRSLLTQAARHHAAQLSFFQKSVQSLEAVEPQIRHVAEQQHIDYQVSGLEDDDGGDGDDDRDSVLKNNDVRELSFDHLPKDVSTSKNSMEVDHSPPKTSAMGNAVIHSEKNREDFKRLVSNHSAPIVSEKSDQAEKSRKLQLSSTNKTNTYVLPTPVDARGTLASKHSSSAVETKASGQFQNLWHSSPLEGKKQDIEYGSDNLSNYNVLRGQAVAKESNTTNTYARLPPMIEELPVTQTPSSTLKIPDAEKNKRLTFSGPLTSKPYSTNPVSSSCVSVSPAELPKLVSDILSRSTPKSLSTKMPLSASPPLVSSPKISELHELPRPPDSSLTNPVKSASLSQSTSLIFRHREIPVVSQNPSQTSNAASPLPMPPFPRSFSIPSSSQRKTAIQVAKLLKSPPVQKVEKVVSPPLTSNNQSTSLS